MSRAFVKENDEEGDELPERPVPTHANYVTVRGFAQLQARVKELAAAGEALRPSVPEDTDAKRQLRVLERDLRYFNAQLERAELVRASSEHDAVHFGARVTIGDDEGRQSVVRIVVDDEADAAAGDISWASPLARALIGAHEGDVVTWRRPAGDAQIEIVAIHYA
ncbi:MAG: transcription elongation factor GreAB [Betaproteobacteria bacterium]|nr:transcription elongation factor GreAB [Betaproteobacteria bacterium]